MFLSRKSYNIKSFSPYWSSRYIRYRMYPSQNSGRATFPHTLEIRRKPHQSRINDDVMCLRIVNPDTITFSRIINKNFKHPVSPSFLYRMSPPPLHCPVSSLPLCANTDFLFGCSTWEVHAFLVWQVRGNRGSGEFKGCCS